MFSSKSDAVAVNKLIFGDESKSYKLLRKIGSGSFGVVYLGVNVNNEKEQVAVKLERSRGVDLNSQLLYESKVYKIVMGSVGIPRMLYYGQHHGFNVMVMDLLGPSLEELFNLCGRRFSLKTGIMLADEMIGRLEYLHRKSLIHRDIKPDNFLVGLGSMSKKLFLIDFGLSKIYRRGRGQFYHIPYSDDKKLTGTARYVSTNVHRGIEQSRRDDLESVAYTLIYFLKGSLPWQNQKASTLKQKHAKIMEIKLGTTEDELCKGIPGEHPEFATFLRYCRGLGFEERPDYLYLRGLFRILLRTLGLKWDFEYDWSSLEGNKDELKEKPIDVSEPMSKLEVQKRD
ncbi:unnamed protein product [Orchesella dallaii]|uniref:non-specific serine/threonine protein kinase n=1 Tax=Orchesella dallaii TaxID=48710 RepID=A0ABP1Q109_9HEXA